MFDGMGNITSVLQSSQNLWLGGNAIYSLLTSNRRNQTRIVSIPMKKVEQHLKKYALVEILTSFYGIHLWNINVRIKANKNRMS